MTKYHFIGIGGVGMSALAHLLHAQKHSISGSDRSSNATTRELEKKGIDVQLSHSASHVRPQDVVIYSSSIPPSNPELLAAQEKGCQILHRAQLLAQFAQKFETLAVAGSHGKTTTSTLLKAVLTQAGLDPSFAIGGREHGGVNGKLGRGSHLVIEADESDGSFLHYHPKGAIVTNCDLEHLDHFGSERKLLDSFAQFCDQVENKEQLFVNGDDPRLPQRGTTFGFSQRCDLQISNFEQKGWKITFDIAFEGAVYKTIELNLPGKHNAYNAAAVVGLALRLGLPFGEIRKALALFGGVQRRMQKQHLECNVLHIDDYAHHPTEIAATLAALAAAHPHRRMVVLFQPHRPSRVQRNLEGYTSCFADADALYVTEICLAGEEPKCKREDLLEKIENALPFEKEIALQTHDLFVTLGAGRLPDYELVISKLRVGLLFGGRSCEHEISLRSARFVDENLDRALYDVRHFGLDQEGSWSLEEKVVEKISGGSHLLDRPIAAALQSCDLFVPIFHGPYGEDGRIQGFFEMLGKPYAGPNYAAAALCMDKSHTKAVVAAAGVPTSRGVVVAKGTLHVDLRYPLYVKPVHLGSSIGISKVYHPEQLGEAIALAFTVDEKVMVEQSVERAREFEFAVRGSGTQTVVPPPGEKCAHGEFVDFAKKYGNKPVPTTVAPDLPAEVIAEGQRLAKLAYQSVNASGITRVDFLLDANYNWWFNEMNPIPGMQKLSLFPKIWAREGLNGTALLNVMIQEALFRKRACVR